MSRTSSPPILTSLRMLLVPLVLCVGASGARAEDDPEPPRPTGEIAEAFARVNLKDYNERVEARAKLFEVVGPKHLDEVIWWSKRGNPVQRETAYELLCYFRMRRTASEEQIKGRIVPALLAGTRDPNVNVRRTVTNELPEYAKHSKELIERLFKLLDDEDRTQVGHSNQGQVIAGYSVAGTAVHSLRRVHKFDKRIFPLIWQKATKGDLRKPALVALGDFGLREGMVSKVLPLLATVFASSKEDMGVRAEAAAAL